VRQIVLRSLENLESRRLLSATAAEPGHLLNLRDEDGSKIVVRIGDTGTVSGAIVRGRLELSVSSDSSDTQLTIDVTGGDGKALARTIKIDSKVGSISAANVELRGLLTGTSITSATFRAIANADVQVGWLGALWARSITGSVITADRIGGINVAGDITGSRIFVSPANDKTAALSSLTVGGTIGQSTIFTLGDVGSVSAAAMIDSNLTAGVRISEDSTATNIIQPLPDAHIDDKLYDFTGTYRIDQLVITGKNKQAVAFSNSVVGAYEVGAVLLYKVDGYSSNGRQFGVAAYKFGGVKRSFDSAHSYKNTVNSPDGDFTIRQISKPIKEFVPTTTSGTYLGAVTLNGSGTINLSGTNLSGGTLRLGSGTFNSGVINVVVPATPVFNNPGITYSDLRIGSVSNSAATDVYLTGNGQYQLRTSSGDVVISALSLSALAADLFKRSKTSIKIENVGNGDVTLRTTSVGPVLRLVAGMLGTTRLPGTNSVTGRPITVIGGSMSVPLMTIPSVADLQHDLGGNTRTFAKPLLLLTDNSFTVGKVISATGEHEVDFTQSFSFASAGSAASDLGQLLTRVTADRIGSRRLPARYITTADGITIYGLPNGATATLHSLGETALNAVGAISRIPKPGVVRQSLTDEGIDFAP
jgi:hypothetical protein